MKKIKKNNKGFSLVELIVVIAIMAVLMGVFAPQFLRYVEKSRLQKDNSAIGEIANAMKIAIADEDVNKELPVDVTLTNSTATDDATVTFSTATMKSDDTAATKMITELNGVIGNSYTTASNTYKKSTTNIVITIAADGKVSATGFYSTQDQSTADTSKSF